MISTRGEGENTRVTINLTSVGGGSIELAGITSVDELDLAVDDQTTDNVDESADDVIQMLDVYNADTNPDGAFIIA